MTRKISAAWFCMNTLRSRGGPDTTKKGCAASSLRHAGTFDIVVSFGDPEMGAESTSSSQVSFGVVDSPDVVAKGVILAIYPGLGGVAFNVSHIEFRGEYMSYMAR